MLVRRVTLQNVRSFLTQQELAIDGGTISILIGPNGGGKTNLLDAIVVMLRRYLYASSYPVQVNSGDEPLRYEFRHNDVLNNMSIERHSNARPELKQLIEIEVEASENDVLNMRAIQDSVDDLVKRASSRYQGLAFSLAKRWPVSSLTAGSRFVYGVVGGEFAHNGDPAASAFREYLQMFEAIALVRSEFDEEPLSRPMLYLPVTRTASLPQTRIELHQYNEFEDKRHSDAVISRSNTTLLTMAVARLAKTHRLLQEEDRGSVNEELRKISHIQSMTMALSKLGYDWELTRPDPMRNAYDILIKKGDSSFRLSAASSGERELLTYLFAIYILNVRDALIVVDEPELHLHPKWQKALFKLFVDLSKTTGNQFLFATHSPSFVGPESIQYISRVFNTHHESRIVRLSKPGLPVDKHLVNIVNSQNNERIFFADHVVLVEGISDRLFFEKVLDKCGRNEINNFTIEVVEVGGKHLFGTYVKILNAAEISHSIIADRDYVEDVGTPDLKHLFKVDPSSIREDVIKNVRSKDAASLVAAVDQAMKDGNWSAAQDIWEYIKNRHSELRVDLKPEDISKLNAFILEKRSERVFILKKGALEAYLPLECKKKDLDPLIRFLDQPDFWSQLAGDQQEEILEIATDIISVVQT